MQRKSLLRLPLLFVAVAGVAGVLLLRDQLTFEALRDHRVALVAFRDAHYALAALAFIAGYIVIVALSLPGAAVATITGGFLFGLFPGVIFNVAASTTGAVLIFLAVRMGVGEGLTMRLKAAGGRAERFRSALRENEFWALLTVRLIPAVPFFVANLLPALVGMRLTNYVAATFLGVIPAAAIYTWLGSGLGEIFARGESPDLSILAEPYILGPLLGLALLAALPMAVKALGGPAR